MLEVLHEIQRIAAIFTHIVNINPAIPPAKASEYAVCLVRSAKKNHIRTSRLAAIIATESKWHDDVVSQTSDFGLGQLHRRKPSKEEIACLLDGCTNIDLTAQFLRTIGSNVGRYNPGNPRYARIVQQEEQKLLNAWRSKKEIRAAILKEEDLE